VPPKNEAYYGRDGLYATVQVISPVTSATGDPANTLVLIAADLHSTSSHLWSVITQHCLKTHNIPVGNVVLSCTHTHSGYGQYHGGGITSAADLKGGSGFYDRMTVASHFPGFDATHADLITSSITGGIDKCLSTLRPGGFAVSEGKCWGVWSNRALTAKARNEGFDEWTRDSRFSPTTPDDETNLSLHDKHIDPRIRAFVTFESPDAPTGAIGTVSCHPTSLGNSVNYYSPDWIGVAKVAAGQSALVPGSKSKKVRSNAKDSALGLASSLAPTFPIGVMQCCAGDISPLPISGPLGVTETRTPGNRPVTWGEELKEVVGVAVGKVLGEVIGFTVDNAITDDDLIDDDRYDRERGRERGRDGDGGDTGRKSVKRKVSSRGWGGWGGWGTRAGGEGGEFAVMSEARMWEPQTATRTDPTMGVATLGGAPCGPTRGLYERVGSGFPSNMLSPTNPQHPKTPIPGLGTLLKYVMNGPKVLPISVVIVNGILAIVTVPGEPTVTVGARIESRIVKDVLHNRPGANCIVLGFGGEYAGYWVTEEEYDEQLYEGSSTLWGRLASRMLEEELVDIGRGLMDGGDGDV
jgi:hypothetical protein